MGSHEHTPVNVDPAALAQAHNMWTGFTTMTKYSVIAIIVLLLSMGFFLL